jgi:hypothetical protein
MTYFMPKMGASAIKAAKKKRDRDYLTEKTPFSTPALVQRRPLQLLKCFEIASVTGHFLAPLHSQRTPTATLCARISGQLIGEVFVRGKHHFLSRKRQIDEHLCYDDLVQFFFVV